MPCICHPCVVDGKAGKMKALSIRQPWATLIIDGHKDIENREWSTRVRGWVAIHASKGCTREEWEDADFFCVLRCLPRPRPLAELQRLRGGFIGFAWLGDCVESHTSPWFVGTYGHVFYRPQPRPFIQYKGQLGYFDVPNIFLQEHWGKKILEIEP